MASDAALRHIKGLPDCRVTPSKDAVDALDYLDGGLGLDCGSLGAPKLRFVTSDQSHVTVAKALAMLGIGTARIETVPTDVNGAMIVDVLPKLDRHTIVIAQAGNVNTGDLRSD